ncbi:MAG: carboxypeptidase-like regulatory domain-containing protein, partial [Algoriphagus sp.]
MRVVYLSSILYFLALNMSFAQQNAVQGKVLDQNQQPIAGASITLEGTVRGVQSDKNGNYQLKDLPKGSYELKASLIGFKPQTIAFSIGKEEVKTFDMTLEEDAIWMESFEVMASRGMNGQGRLPEVEDFRINAGRKSEVIRLGEIDANLAMNNSRQIFGRTPGISIWENDGSGIQLGVASRGLSPNRSWEFNVRMNGYDITPDPMGYPEAYFTPPME